MPEPASAISSLPSARVLRGGPFRSRLRAAAAGTLIVAFVVEAGRGPAGLAVGALLVLSLLATVRTHRTRRNARPPRASLRTPGQVALALAFAVTAGSVVAVFGALVLSAAASSMVGDGSFVIRLLLALVGVGSSFAIGSRCGRWWAFSGALGLVPLLTYAMLVDGQAARSGIGLCLVAVLASSLGLAVGSLNSAVADARAVNRRQRATAPRRIERVASVERGKRAAVPGR